MSDIVNDQSIAENSDPVVSEQAVQYWGGEPNVEDTQQVEAPVEASPEIGLEPFENENPVQSVPENTEGSEQQRYQYWQSRYDQKASEFDTMSQKLAEYEKVAPIAEYIQENPDILKGVAKSLSGDTPQVPSQEKSMELPQKPQRPTKPTNYDATEAYMDTDSASFKYRQQLDEYRDSMIDYQDSVEQNRVQQLKAEQQKIVQERQAYEAQQAQSGMLNQLTSGYGYTPEKAQEFMQYYSSPDSITLENLVQLDRLRNAPSQQEVATQQKVQELQNAKERMKVPTPTAVQTGNAEPQYSDEDLFNLGLMANKR